MPAEKLSVLCLYPGFNPEVNDIALVLPQLVNRGASVTVITAQENPSKSIRTSSVFEDFRGVQIYRPFRNYKEMMLAPERQREICIKYALAADPDVILCSQEFNFRLALMIRRSITVPIVLVSEFAGDIADGKPQWLRIQARWCLSGVPALGKSFWRWLQKHSAAIITAYPGDAKRLDALSAGGPPVVFVPWCNEPPQYNPAPARQNDKAIYMGAFSKFKNTGEFEISLPLLLEDTPLQKFILVGQGDTQIIEQLQKRYGQRIEYMPGLPREQALNLLSECYFGYTPVTRGGWGFIGDCWASGTPLLATHNDYQLRDGIDAVVASGPTAISAAARRLYAEPQTYQRLQENGRKRQEAHSAAAVGSAYYKVLRSVATPKVEAAVAASNSN